MIRFQMLKYTIVMWFTELKKIHAFFIRFKDNLNVNSLPHKIPYMYIVLSVLAWFPLQKLEVF